MCKEPLSNVDLALLKMDAPNNLMVITGLMVLETRLDIQQLKATLENRLLNFNRFRQRVVQSHIPLQRFYWEDDPNFDLDNHLVLIEQSIPADRQLLQHLVSRLMALPLHPSRPLWQFYLVKNYGQGSALICRMHHSIADGIALMKVLLSMTDCDPKPCESLDGSYQRTHSAGGGEAFADEVRGVSGWIFRDPVKTIGALRKGADVIKSVGRFVLSRPDPKTVFKGELGGQKRAVWRGPLSLAQVKHIKNAFGCTVNDVLLAMLAGALRKYMLYHDDKISTRKLHSFVPVNLRSPQAREQLGNQFGLVYLSLPIGLEEPMARLRRVQENMNQLKSSNEAIATFGLLYLLGATPIFQGFTLSLVDSKGSAVVTNVAGPKDQLYLAGAPIKTVVAWVPKSGHVGLGVSLTSYNGGVWICIGADSKLVPDPERLLDYFDEEFQAFADLAGEVQAEAETEVAPILEMLDSTLETLDGLLAEYQSGANGNQPSEKTRCQAETKSGRRCKNPATSGEVYCWLHLDVEKAKNGSS
jgi:WS/DGAT/MGAT family acyltransferase